jgi:uncharacterized membrane protein YfcA
LVSVALLPLVLPFKEALFLLAILNLPVCALTLYATRHHFTWRRGLTLTLGATVGVPIGFYALVHFDSGLLLRLLGTVLCLFALHELFLSRRVRLRFPSWAGFPIGIVSGALGGSLNAGGPPVIAYVYSQDWAKEEIVAVLQLVFGVSALIRVALIGQSGLLHAELGRLSLLALVPLIGGITLGNRLLRRVQLPALKTGVFSFLLLMGAKYLLTTNPIH